MANCFPPFRFLLGYVAKPFLSLSHQSEMISQHFLYSGGVCPAQHSWHNNEIHRRMENSAPFRDSQQNSLELRIQTGLVVNM